MGELTVDGGTSGASNSGGLFLPLGQGGVRILARLMPPTSRSMAVAKLTWKRSDSGYSDKAVLPAGCHVQLFTAQPLSKGAEQDGDPIASRTAFAHVWLSISIQLACPI